MKRFSIFTALVCAILLLPASAAFASQDGFNTAKTLEGRFFTIELEKGVDTSSLAMKIAVPSSIRAIVQEPMILNETAPEDQADLLYLAVLEIMDIRLKTFHGKIKVCRDYESLKDVATKLFGRPVKTGGFYVLGLDTLYVDAENISIHILGHEMSHMVQTHYFVVPPPTKIQEVLAGFVEYELRKRG